MKKTLYIVLAVLLSTGGCKTRQPLQIQPLPSFDREAHRGGRGLNPENTIPAMLKAIDLGVTTLEMDAHITSDRKVVLMHDDQINPLFTLNNGKELTKEEAKKSVIYQMNYTDLDRFDVGSKYYSAFPQQVKQQAQIPLLEDLIVSVQNYLKATGKPQVFYNIETKSSIKGDNIFHPEPEIFVKLLMNVIEKKKNISPWVIVQSFDPRTLEVLHTQYPEIKTAFLVSNNSLEENLKLLSFLPTIYSPNLKLVTAELIKDCHYKGMKIIPWTVNEKNEITRLKLLGVDGIITDYPNLF
ncbi:glycerophosphodiester phosphodiesterase family protein [Pedobacter sp. P351]|uniref:glycerophosphodiester phosphodiesterase family protein n=1 Tax=Pedobacter superstes TaxID=3133441 RepID=UPI0030B6A47A